MLYSIVGMLVIILDQLVKFGVDRTINWTDPVRTVIPGVLSLVRVQNDGAAFSFLSGSGARVWFIVITGIFAVLVVLALATNFVSGKFGRWCLVFITAGGLSNMIDRIRYGYVIDMFRIELFDFAVFNVADIFITVFCIAFIIYILFGGEKEKDPEVDEFDGYDYEDDDRPARVSAKKHSSRRDEYDDEEEDDRSRRRSSRGKGSRYEEYDDEEDDAPRRIAGRSAAAAAGAYRQRAEQHSRQGGNRSGDDSDQRNTYRSDRASEQRDAYRGSQDYNRRAAESISGNGSASSASGDSVRSREGSRQNRTAAGTTARAEAAPVRTSASGSGRVNPFAEWEQANERVASGRSFRNYNEQPEAEASPAPQKTSASGSSSDMDLDAILSEFQ